MSRVSLGTVSGSAPLRRSKPFPQLKVKQSRHFPNGEVIGLAPAATTRANHGLYLSPARPLVENADPKTAPAIAPLKSQPKLQSIDEYPTLTDTCAARSPADTRHHARSRSAADIVLGHIPEPQPPIPFLTHRQL